VVKVRKHNREGPPSRQWQLPPPFFGLDDSNRVYKLQENVHGKILAVEVQAVWPVWPWVLWPYSEALLHSVITVCCRIATVMCGIRWCQDRMASLLACRQVCTSAHAQSSSRLVIVLPSSKKDPAHEKEHWQTHDTRTQSHTHARTRTHTLNWSSGPLPLPQRVLQCVM
jgi:hypothetical protein